MKEEKFKVINYIRELVISVDKHLDNFPKKDIEIKNRVRNISYDILELAYRVNVSTNANKKLELIEEIVAKIKVADFLINMCYDKQIINSKRYVKFGESLDNILKYLVGWKKSIEQRAQLLGLASPGVNANSDNANFGPGAVNDGNANSGNNNLFNSNGNWNANGYAVRPVDSIHCGYTITCCIRDNIETNCCPFTVYLFVILPHELKKHMLKSMAG